MIAMMIAPPPVRWHDPDGIVHHYHYSYSFWDSSFSSTSISLSRINNRLLLRGRIDGIDIIIGDDVDGEGLMEMTLFEMTM